MTEHIHAKLLLDVSEVQQILGLGRSQVYAYLLRGDLRSLKLGRRRKIPVEALHDFVRWLQETSGQDGES